MPLATGNRGETGLIQDWLVRAKAPIFFTVAALHVLAFNGQWRIGRDSSLYRALGHSLATTGRYTFRGEPHALALPGYPVMLAGLERVFGNNVYHPVPQLLFMMVLAAATLVLVYRLIIRHYPEWTAVAVTAALGLNWRFHQQANELMTDTPFLFAVCVALLGFERIQESSSFRERIYSTLLMLTGLGLCASLRPTFWPVVGAWVIACVWGLLRNGKKKPFVIALGVAAALLVGWLLIDPRTRSISPMGGGYESKVTAKLQNLGRYIATHFSSDDPEADDARDHTQRLAVVKMFLHHFPEAMFGIELWWFSVPVMALVVLYAVWTMRRAPLWGWLALLSMVMFAVFGSTPRYFLMIMPILILGWFRRMHHVSQGLSRRGPRWRWAGQALFAAGAGLLVLPNMGKCALFILEQHGLAIERKHTPLAALPRPVAFLPIVKGQFLQVYRDGAFLPHRSMAELIALQVPAEDAVLGPEPRILSYLSGRRVFSLTDLAQRKGSAGDRLTDVIEEHALRWIVLPADVYTPETDPLADKMLADHEYLDEGVDSPFYVLEQPRLVHISDQGLRAGTGAGSLELFAMGVVDRPRRARLPGSSQPASTRPSSRPVRPASRPSASPADHPATRPL